MLKEIVVANKNYVSMDVNPEETLDQTAIKVIRYDCPPFLLPIRLTSMDNEVQLRFEMTGGVRMAYMPMRMKKWELNQLLEQMLIPFRDSADWFLDYHNIYLDRNYIMVNQENFKINYIYMPYEKKVQTEEQIMRFFGDLVMEVELQDDPAYIATLLRSIMGRESSILAFSNIVMDHAKVLKGSPDAPKENTVQPLSTVKREEIPNNGNFMSVRRTVPEPPVEKKVSSPTSAVPTARGEFGKSNLADSIEMELFGETSKEKNKKAGKAEKHTKAGEEKKSKGLFGKLLGGDKKSKKEDLTPQTGSLGPDAPIMPAPKGYPQNMAVIQPDYGMEGKTEFVISEEVDTGGLRLSLESSSIDNMPGSIELDMSKGYAVVGRYDKTGKLSADFNFDMSLTFIGRRHMRFEKSEEGFFIIDLESKNHTYLNGEELLPNYRYPLNKGDRIMITKKYSIIYKVC